MLIVEFPHIDAFLTNVVPEPSKMTVRYSMAANIIAASEPQA